MIALGMGAYAADEAPTADRAGRSRNAIQRMYRKLRSIPIERSTNDTQTNPGGPISDERSSTVQDMRHVSIIFAGAMIAAAIMITNHWTIVPMPAVTNGVSMALQVDRWTGTARVCLTRADSDFLACPK